MKWTKSGEFSKSLMSGLAEGQSGLAEGKTAVGVGEIIAWRAYQLDEKKKLGWLGENGALLSYLALFQGKCGALSLRNTGLGALTVTLIIFFFFFFSSSWYACCCAILLVKAIGILRLVYWPPIFQKWWGKFSLFYICLCFSRNWKKIRKKIKKSSKRYFSFSQNIFGGGLDPWYPNECLWWPHFLLSLLEGNILKTWKKCQKYW